MRIPSTSLAFALLLFVSSAFALACQSSSPSSEGSAVATSVAAGTTPVPTPEPEVPPVPASDSVGSKTEGSSGGEPKADAPTGKTAALTVSAPKPAAAPAPAAASKAAAEPAAQPAPAPAVEKPCLAKSFEFAAVKSACEKGGVPRAKSLMKGWTNKAKEKGESYKCASCHDNQRTYTNKPNADADLRKLLALVK